MWTGPAVVAPLWQGSSITTGQQAARGAEQLALALLSRSELARVRTIQAPVAARGAEAVALMRSRLADLLEVVGADQPVLLLGGDCSVDLALLDRSLARGATVLWLDAHADANTPASSPSGAPHGMVARTAMEEHADRLVYVGVRTTDEEEARWIAEREIPVLPVSASSDEVLAALPPTGPIHLHVDLDVLDPTSFSGVGFPEPGGMDPATLVDVVAGVQASGRMLALTFAEHVLGHDRQRDAAVLQAIGHALA